MESRTYRLPAEAGAVAGPVPAAISVENVKKTFIIPDERYTSFKSRAVALFRPQGHRTREALDELSFEVQRGEFFGVVGPNGSGKSTLLKCIAGIYGTDAGCVAVTGRLSPFLEMGVGFEEEFTARENVVLNGTQARARARPVLCSPVFYLATQYPEAVRDTVGMTPIVMILTEMHHAFIDPSAPSAAALVGGAAQLLVPIALSVGVFGLGMLVFNRQAPRAAELL